MSDVGKLEDIIITNQDTKELLEMQKQIVVAEPSIPQLKKRIKYCRNLMEKKKLQQELNQAYKEQKKKR